MPTLAGLDASENATSISHFAIGSHPAGNRHLNIAVENVSCPSTERQNMADMNTPKIKREIEQAESGDAAAAEKIEKARDIKPEAADAAEQEAADGPAGRGLSR
jgi:hypothetical protein